MGQSSSTAHPTVADSGSYMPKKQPKVTRLKFSEMAVTMESQIPQHEDLNLMGLHELDSHLSIFETSDPARGGSSTPSMSNLGFDNNFNMIDQHSHTIIVESPSENYSPRSHFGTSPHPRFADQKSIR